MASLMLAKELVIVDNAAPTIAHYGGDSPAVAAAAAGGSLRCDGVNTGDLVRSVSRDSSSTPRATSLLPAESLDAIIVAMLHLQDASAEEETAASAREATRALARALRFMHSTDMIASIAPRLLARLSGDVQSWTKGCLHLRVFDTLLRIARPALACESREDALAAISTVVDVFCATLGESVDATLRVSQLALLDAFIVGSGEREGEEPARATALARLSSASDRDGSPSAAAHSSLSSSVLPSRTEFDAVPLDRTGPGHSMLRRPSTAKLEAAAALPPSVSRVFDELPQLSLVAPTETPARVALAGGHAAHSVTDAAVDDALIEGGGSLRILHGALLPGIVWRAGLVASAIRKVSLACVRSLLLRRLLRPSDLEAALPRDLLASIKGCSSDDDPATRLIACRLLSDVCSVLHKRLSSDTVRGLYDDLLKRLDDSNDAVRVAACGAIAGLVHSAAHPRDLQGSPAEVTIEVLLIHLDDGDARVQEAVYDALVPWCDLAPAFARSRVAEGLDKRRRPSLSERLLARLGGQQQQRAHPH